MRWIAILVPPGAPGWGRAAVILEANYLNTTFDTGVLCPTPPSPKGALALALPLPTARPWPVMNTRPGRTGCGCRLLLTVGPGRVCFQPFFFFSAILCPQAVCLEWTLSTSWLMHSADKLRRSVLFLFPLFLSSLSTSARCMLCFSIYCKMPSLIKGAWYWFFFIYSLKQVKTGSNDSLLLVFFGEETRTTNILRLI